MFYFYIKFYFYLAALVALSSAACSTQWPNGTDTTIKWWQCDSGPIQVFNATPFDTAGNFEYPIHLGKPLVMQVQLNNPRNTYTKPNLRDTINIWMWNRQTCSWTSIPTLGLLSNQDACASGVPCPVNTGNQWLPVTIDFTPYSAIINQLKDDMPYQLQYLLHDKKSGDQMCLMFQARAYLH